ncbi:MAG: oxaloacetate decarboxylase [Flavobacteriaceae bacterium]
MSGLAELLRAGTSTAAPGVHDALTAKIAARAGHRALYLGGNAMALGLGKGQPFLTLTETADITARVAAAINVPVLVDAGAGFGEAAHLDTAVRALEKAGAAGLHIDDQPYPKRAAYHRGAGSLVEPGVMIARVLTAKAARQNPDFPIIARTDALRATTSLDETVARCRAYAEAGADALMVLDLGPAQAGVVRDACPEVPLIWIGGVTTPVPMLGELDAAGFRLACYPFNGFAALSTALADLWQNLADTGRVVQHDETLARARADMIDLADLRRAWDVEDRHG